MNRKQNKKRIAGQKESLAKRRWVRAGADLMWDLLWVCYALETDDQTPAISAHATGQAWKRCFALSEKAFHG